MSWSNQGGGGPWGGGGGPGQPPNLDELLRRGQEGLKKIIPGGVGGGPAKRLAGTAQPPFRPNDPLAVMDGRHGSDFRAASS